MNRICGIVILAPLCILFGANEKLYYFFRSKEDTTQVKAHEVLGPMHDAYCHYKLIGCVETTPNNHL